MYLNRFSVKNIRSISEAVMTFAKGEEAGWHVILGSNGAGKSSLIRAFALLMMGEKEAYAARQEFERWIRKGETQSSINGQVSRDGDWDTLTGNGQPPKQPITLQATLEKNTTEPDRAPEIKFSGKLSDRSIWGGGRGWFSASFGPYRRFTGGDNRYDRLFLSNKRLAPHLTALGEDVALTDAMAWLTNLYTQSLQDEKNHVSPSNASLIYAGIFQG
jgi:predicted ATPase